MSYDKASKQLTDGEISRQTVMGKIRRSGAQGCVIGDRRRVAELHIDADEAHVTLRGGRRSEVPLISVYEGIERLGKRHRCRNVFHISEYGKSSDDLWEQALTEVEARYDLTGTKIYLHGDGANWILKGLEWFPGATYVLDKYHKNSALKRMTAGLSQADRRVADREIRESLESGDMGLFDELTKSLCDTMPAQANRINENARYLKNFSAAISVCKTDPGANNGGRTEPHVSHVLSHRLSSRPMAWSKHTLHHFAPILASESIALQTAQCQRVLPPPLRKAVAQARKAFRKNTAGLPTPDAIGTLPISGKISGTQVLLKRFA